MDRLKAAAHEPLAHLTVGHMILLGFVTGLFMLAVAYVLGTVASRAVTSVLARREVAIGVRFALAKLTRYVVVLIVGLTALAAFGIRLEPLLAASTAVFVGVGFGLQNVAQNFVSGLILLIERPVTRGDFVQVGQAFGSIADVGLRSTRVVTRDQVTIIVPNSELTNGQVINHSLPTAKLRIAVQVGVAYGTNMARAREAMLAVARSDVALLVDPAPEVCFDDFGESSLDVSLLAWIRDPREDLRATSRLRFAIEVAFRAAGIEMPFPQREVRVR